MRPRWAIWRPADGPTHFREICADKATAALNLHPGEVMRELDEGICALTHHVDGEGFAERPPQPAPDTTVRDAKATLAETAHFVAPDAADHYPADLIARIRAERAELHKTLAAALA